MHVSPSLWNCWPSSCLQTHWEWPPILDWKSIYLLVSILRQPLCVCFYTSVDQWVKTDIHRPEQDRHEWTEVWDRWREDNFTQGNDRSLWPFNVFYNDSVGSRLVARLVFVGSRLHDLSGCKLKSGRRCVCLFWSEMLVLLWYQIVLKACKQNLQMDVCMTKSRLHKLYFIFSPVPETTSLTQSSAFFNTVLF